MRWKMQQQLAWLLLASVSVCHAFYIPGVSTRVYSPGTTIPLYVNKLYSDQSQLTYAYSEQSFVCKSSKQPLSPASKLLTGTSVGLNLGEILRGDRITLSDFQIRMGEDVQKEKLCDVDLDLTAAVEAYELIENDYRIEWIMDNLPGATPFVIKTNNGGVREQKYYSRGFALGNIVKDATHAGEDTQRPDQTFLHNHFTMIIRYRQADEQADGTNGKVIVGFEVYPKSISNTPADRDERGLPKNIEKPEAGFELNMPDINRKARNKAGYKFTVPYTYSVIFKEDNTVTWGNRWDRFMAPQDKAHGIHWLAIINSLVISGLLAVVVAVIFTRTIKGDIKGRGDGALDDGRSSKINGRGGLLDPMDRRSKEEIEASDDVDDVTGWKLLHSDVFRSPVHRNPLAALVGVGVQLVFMASGLLVLGCIGFLSPSMRGGFASVGMGLFILGGAFAGYAAGRTYKTLGGERWKVNTLMTAGLVPGLVFGTVFLLNLLAWSQASSTALPFTTLLAIFALWIVFQLPLVYIGAYVGFVRHGSYAVPIRPNAIPRQIPAKPWWTGSYASLLLSGIIPFVAVFIELMAMFKSVWQDKSSYYYLFGFATCVFLILVITIIELSIVTTYFLLCHEDYRWHWPAFTTGAASAVWVFLYCVYYYFTRLHLHGLASSVLFFAYSALGCTVYGLLMGTLGFLSAWTFVRRIYTAIKVD